MRDSEIIVDNFAGGGGASTGIELAIGRSVDIAINHDPNAVAMHTTNHPDTLHYCESVYSVRPKVATAGRPVALAWFSPDCFPAGTLVLTQSGYKKIEDIRVGEFVLTHKRRWRQVVETSNAERPTTKIRGHGHPGLTCSLEHPFYIKARRNVWNNNIRQYRPEYDNAEWVPASLVQKGHYWATPTSVPEMTIPEMTMYTKGTFLPVDERLLWLAGRYVGDGWTRLTETRAELVIICGKHEVDELEERINMWPRVGHRVIKGELSWCRREVRTACQLTANSRALVEWLRKHFGHKAEYKKLPAWLYGASNALKKAFIDGYMSADGWHGQDAKQGDMFEANTVSKGLAFGMKQLISTLGYSGTVFVNTNPTCVIEGRMVNARASYKVRWREAVCGNHTQTFDDDGLLWAPVRENTPLNRIERVFNIGVEDDESYVVEGVIVHNCRHFSKAKGAKPVEKAIRGLAWMVLRWGLDVKPRVMKLENVEEFKTWGPLLAGEMRPDPARAGETFEAFIGMLTTGISAGHPALAECCEFLNISLDSEDAARLVNGLGYTVEYRALRACDYGAPTIRKRFFMVMRCDGKPIVWPEATHGDPKSPAVLAGKLAPWRTAAECIDWSIPAPSIFDRKKTLAVNTLKRIAQGIQRFVIDSTSPFIVKCNHTSTRARYDCFRGQSLDEPLQTITKTHGYAIAVPHLTKFRTGATGKPVTEPVPTVTAGTSRRPGGNGHALGIVEAELAPFLAGNGGSEYQAKPRPIDKPAHTILKESRACVVAPVIARQFGASVGHRADEPSATITAGGGGKSQLVVPTLIQMGYGERPGQAPRVPGLDKPLGTVVAGGGKHAVVGAFLAKHYGGNYQGAGVGLDEPAHSVTTVDHHALVASHLVKLRGTCRDGQPTDEPMPTITAGGQHVGEVKTTLAVEDYDEERAQQVLAFLQEYCGEDSTGLVEIGGVTYRIVDIGMRMLQPRELYRAQGFPEWYIIDQDYRGVKYAKDKQVARCGNAVPPPFAEALVRANLPELCQKKDPPPDIYYKAENATVFEIC
ncbi:DNA cytosine methyltransferase [Klebsiella oxytoca]|uniref:DNA cytosine methyltransferase n=1 Tax=Klebsiella oxytoca TaxID=571 RepID=UPI002A0A3025|nr:DNA cytosine methyltransferase [Klebsiella oxytoca]